jgi:hypothetical protein
MDLPEAKAKLNRAQRPRAWISRAVCPLKRHLASLLSQAARAHHTPSSLHLLALTAAAPDKMAIAQKAATRQVAKATQGTRSSR